MAGHLPPLTVTCLGIRRVARTRRQKPQSPAPKGAIGQADDRAKADKEAQRLERDQAKQRNIQLASTGSAKASIRSRDAAPDTFTKPKTAKKTDKSISSIEAPTLETGDTPAPKAKATVRKRPAQLDDESLRLESSALPQTPAESETSHNPAESEPSPADKGSDGAQSSRAIEQTTQEPSNVRRRVSKKGAAIVAEQGSITGLRSDDPTTPPIQETEVVASSSSAPAPSSIQGTGVVASSSTTPATESGPVVERQKWGDLPDDPPESFNTVELEVVHEMAEKGTKGEASGVEKERCFH